MKPYQYMLKQKGIRQSMSRKGNCLDNSLAENFFGILKSELFYPKEKEYKNIEELEKDIIEYIEYYKDDIMQMYLFVLLQRLYATIKVYLTYGGDMANILIAFAVYVVIAWEIPYLLTH